MRTRLPVNGYLVAALIISLIWIGCTGNEVRTPEAVTCGQASFASTSLCDLVKHMDAAGYYEVANIKQYPDEHPGQTFVYLDLIAPWTKSPPESPTVRIPVGPTGDGVCSSQSTAASMELGEKLGLLLDQYDNSSDYSVSPIDTFRSRDGEMTNGADLFRGKGLSQDKIGQKVRTLHEAVEDGKECPFDVKPTTEESSRSNTLEDVGDDETPPETSKLETSSPG